MLFVFDFSLLQTWFSVVAALTIFFPCGTPTAAAGSQMVSWVRGKDDPDDEFFLQKNKVIEADGVETEPVTVDSLQIFAGIITFHLSHKH